MREREEAQKSIDTERVKEIERQIVRRRQR